MFTPPLTPEEILLLKAFNEYGELSSARWALRYVTEKVEPLIRHLVKLGLITNTVPYRLTRSGRRYLKENASHVLDTDDDGCPPQH